jgi:hypothetical protein
MAIHQWYSGQVVGPQEKTAGGEPAGFDFAASISDVVLARGCLALLLTWHFPSH